MANGLRTAGAPNPYVPYPVQIIAAILKLPVWDARVSLAITGPGAVRR